MQCRYEKQVSSISILDSNGKRTALDEFEKLYTVLEESCSKCSSNLISLSGGLDSTIIAYFLKKQKPKGLAVIAEDFVSTDLTYCQMAANALEIPLSIYSVKTAEILDAVENTIKILKNFNDIEIRNNVVMYLSIKKAKEMGEKSIITGDGADELFAGYSFLANMTNKKLQEELERIRKIMHFPTQRIGQHLGIKIESPFLDEKVKNYAIEIPVNLKVKMENERRWGKWILRKTFEKHIPPQIAWRRKSPMQDGAGTSGLTSLFESIIDEERYVEKKLTVEKEDTVVIRSRESMYYYEIFRKLYGIPVDSTAETQCPYCKHEVRDSKFCRMCGAFPI